ncbi:serine aminopeptidase domain-containing protein [Nocardia fluminea]|uniref:Putative alpha/beta hydrolase n=1 Tax=Nocardia fluminea TaxID=134984 RepID=A0A2N3WXG6_9NOCA|nr:alpha/beta hydrolase [Nocardia fluminea]PKV98545.1 putative alpha/beta hydrolase [Nocardia fluminea]
MSRSSSRQPGETGSGRGMDAPIVLIAPAMAIGSRFYAPLVAAFTDLGWSARALPRRGFEKGAPRASRHNDWSYQDEIDTIAQAVAEARREHPTRPVVLLGHSLGAQLTAGHELNHPGADGMVTVGGSLPYHRHFPKFGLPVAIMASLVPVITAVFGYLPAPAFGAPGARTQMREWAGMVLTGRPPYPAPGTIDTPTLVIALEDDALAPRRGIEAFARRLFTPGRVTRWDYRSADVPAGASNDHIQWVRTPGAVVDRIATWWHEVSATAGPASVTAGTD